MDHQSTLTAAEMLEALPDIDDALEFVTRWIRRLFEVAGTPEDGAEIVASVNRMFDVVRSARDVQNEVQQWGGTLRRHPGLTGCATFLQRMFCFEPMRFWDAAVTLLEGVLSQIVSAPTYRAQIRRDLQSP